MPVLTINELEQLAPVFRGKVGNAFGRGLMHLLAVDKVNALYDRNMGVEGPAFARALLEDIGLRYEAGLSPDCLYRQDCGFLPERTREAISSVTQRDLSDMLKHILPEGPFITISNHPCGHVDGISLVDLFGHIRSDYKVMVNKILGRVEALAPNFISVTPTGMQRTAPTSASISGIKTALHHLRDGGSLGLFPSGAVSDLHLKRPGVSEPAVRDREWQEAVVRLVVKAEVPVLPVRFFDGNSAFYYSLGLIDWRVRLLRLLPEVFNKSERRFRIGIGPLISVEEQRKVLESVRPYDAVRTFSSYLRSKVYGMEMPEVFLQASPL